MLEVEALRYSEAQIVRWRHRIGGYLDHRMIAEAPHAFHRTRLQGDRWMPDGLPDRAFYLAAGNARHGYHVHTSLSAAGQAVFGTGVGTFGWYDLAVLDETGADLWTGAVDLGSKRPDDVWVVTVTAG